MAQQEPTYIIHSSTLASLAAGDRLDILETLAMQGVVELSALALDNVSGSVVLSHKPHYLQILENGNEHHSGELHRTVSRRVVDFLQRNAMNPRIKVTDSLHLHEHFIRNWVEKTTQMLRHENHPDATLLERTANLLLAGQPIPADDLLLLQEELWKALRRDDVSAKANSIKGRLLQDFLYPGAYLFGRSDMEFAKTGDYNNYRAEDTALFLEAVAGSWKKSPVTIVSQYGKAYENMQKWLTWQAFGSPVTLESLEHLVERLPGEGEAAWRGILRQAGSQGLSISAASHQLDQAGSDATGQNKEEYKAKRAALQFRMENVQTLPLTILPAPKAELPLPANAPLDSVLPSKNEIAARNAPSPHPASPMIPQDGSAIVTVPEDKMLLPDFNIPPTIILDREAMRGIFAGNLHPMLLMLAQEGAIGNIVLPSFAMAGLTVRGLQHFISLDPAFLASLHDGQKSGQPSRNPHDTDAVLRTRLKAFLHYMAPGEESAIRVEDFDAAYQTYAWHLLEQHYNLYYDAPFYVRHPDAITGIQAGDLPPPAQMLTWQTLVWSHFKNPELRAYLDGVRQQIMEHAAEAAQLYGYDPEKISYRNLNGPHDVFRLADIGVFASVMAQTARDPEAPILVLSNTRTTRETLLTLKPEYGRNFILMSPERFVRTLDNGGALWEHAIEEAKQLGINLPNYGAKERFGYAEIEPIGDREHYMRLMQEGIQRLYDTTMSNRKWAAWLRETFSPETRERFNSIYRG